MLRIPFSLMILAQAQFVAPEIQFFRSKTNPNIEYVLVDDCAVPIPLSLSRNYCYIEKKVNTFCKLDIRLDKCDGQE